MRTRWNALLVSLGVDATNGLSGMLGSGGVSRPIRFGIVGIVTFGVQIGFFALFKAAGLPSVVANAFALALAVQFNFAANQLLVWADLPVRLWSRAFAERWATYHGCIAVSLVVNFGAFVVAHLFMPDVLAVMVGIVSSTAIKFISLERYAFRPNQT